MQPQQIQLPPMQLHPTQLYAAQQAPVQLPYGAGPGHGELMINTLPQPTLQRLVLDVIFGQVGLHQGIVHWYNYHIQAENARLWQEPMRFIDFSDHARRVWNIVNVEYENLQIKIFRISYYAFEDVEGIIKDINETVASINRFETKQSALQALCDIAEYIADGIKRHCPLGPDFQAWFGDDTSIGDGMVRILQTVQPEDIERVAGSGKDEDSLQCRLYHVVDSTEEVAIMPGLDRVLERLEWDENEEEPEEEEDEDEEREEEEAMESEYMALGYHSSQPDQGPLEANVKENAPQNGEANAIG